MMMGKAELTRGEEKALNAKEVKGGRAPPPVGLGYLCCTLRRCRASARAQGFVISCGAAYIYIYSGGRATGSPDSRHSCWSDAHF